MSNNLRLKTLVLLGVLVISSAIGMYPIVASWLGIARPAWLLERKLKLGLDLRGGVHLVLRVHIPPETPSAERAALLAEELRAIEHRVDELGVAEPIIASQANGEEILVQLPGVTDVERAKTIIRSTGILELKRVESGPSLSRDALLVDLIEPQERSPQRTPGQKGSRKRPSLFKSDPVGVTSYRTKGSPRSFRRTGQ